MIQKISLFGFVLCTIFFLLINPFTSMAQTDSYSQKWKDVENLMNKDQPRSALKVVNDIYKDAKQKGNTIQQLKAALSAIEIEASYEDSLNATAILNKVDSIINKSSGVMKQVAYSVRAQALQNYLDGNRYNLQNRTALQNDTSKDVQTWSANKLQQEIQKSYQASLQNPAELQQTKLNDYLPLLSTADYDKKLQTSLYDVLVNRALNYYNNTQNFITKPVYEFQLNDSAAFAPAQQFVKHRFATKDSVSALWNAVKLYQNILQYNMNNGNTDALLYNDLERLQFINEHSNLPNKDSLYKKALQRIIDQYGGTEYGGEAAYTLATIYIANLRAAKKSLAPGVDSLEAIANRYKQFNAGKKAYNDLQGIKTPTLSIQNEGYEMVGQNIKVLAQYTNIPTLYVTAIKVPNTFAVRDDYNYSNKKLKEKIKSLLADKQNYLQQFSIQLPAANDYNAHSAEFKIDAVSTPTAIALVCTTSPTYDSTTLIATLNVINTTQIVYIKNDKVVTIVDRATGEPLPKATVTFSKYVYNNTTRQSDWVKIAQRISDNAGNVEMPGKIEHVYQFKMDVAYNKSVYQDVLQTYNDYYNEQDERIKNTIENRVYYFTDRAIYRPGQTVYFKGIATQIFGDKHNNKVVTNQEIFVTLHDVNNDEVDSVTVTTNNYGSFSGSFKLPLGKANGSFSIEDDFSNDSYEFNVEEYKRPKFYAELQKPTGTYALNDSIQVNGLAKAYAGNAIDGAQVTYSIKRTIRFPFWRYYDRSYNIDYDNDNGYGYPPTRNNTQVTQGTTVTDAAGNFTIPFTAVPDPQINKKTLPIYTFEVSATVTDINGETHSTQTNIQIAYQAFELKINAPAKVSNTNFDSLVRISAFNFSGDAEVQPVTITLQKLNEPQRVFRERKWLTPDQFIYTQQQFYTYFPFDEYKDESKITNWSVADTVVKKNTQTQKDGTTQLLSNPQNITTGQYKLIVTATDKNGYPIANEAFIFIEATQAAKVMQPLVTTVSSTSVEPNATVTYQTFTGYDKLWLFQSMKRQNTQQEYWRASGMNNQPLSKIISIGEADRGSLKLVTATYKYNRFYQSEQTVIIPWNNKDLQVRLATFRDKLQPGQADTWKLTISGNKADAALAEVLASMYDASLDAFSKNNWQNLSSAFSSYNAISDWQSGYLATLSSNVVNNIKRSYKNINQKSWADLQLSIDLSSDNRYYNRMRFSAPVAVASAEVMYDSTNTYASDKDEETESSAMSKRVSSNLVSGLQGKVSGLYIQTVEPDYFNKKPSSPNFATVKARSNFNETAFFYPHLQTDSVGNVSFNFTMPEALTSWKFQALAHTPALASGVMAYNVVTQKDLMVQPNLPRFLRQGDQMELSAKIVNLSDKEQTGSVQLELKDVSTNESVDGWFKNVFPVQYFTAAAGQSIAVRFPVTVPENFTSALTITIKAITKDESFSDGEENAIPILSNKTLVTETKPLNLRNTTSKKFTFDKLLQSGTSSTLQQQQLAFEFTTNPAWYAVQALPYLMEYPYECAEQTFNRLYANSLAGYITSTTPKIRAIFDQWRTVDTAALQSNLLKNEQFKNALIEETPWVIDAANETKQKQNIALLFDLLHIQQGTASALQKLTDLQLPSGAFGWFKGGDQNRYITQYIVTGLGHLQQLTQNKMFTETQQNQIKNITNKALVFLDEAIAQEYKNLLKQRVVLSNDNLSNYAIQYLYMRSFFKNVPVLAKAKTAVTYYTGQSQKYWTGKTKMAQAMIALYLKRNNSEVVSKNIIKSFKETASYSDEMGMYFKEYNSKNNYYWYQEPIETQSLVIEAFQEIDKNKNTLNNLKTWLLKQKQTHNWSNSKSTADAVYALLLTGNNWLGATRKVTIQTGSVVINSADEKTEAGTGYFQKQIAGTQVKPDMGNITVTLTSGTGSTESKPIDTSLTAWGAAYWQYFEVYDKITEASAGLNLKRSLYKQTVTDRGEQLQPIADKGELKVGDKVIVRIEIRSDRDLEYVHMKDTRASSMEPVNVLSSYKWKNGLGYYETTKDASTSFFFDYLPKGTYVFEYPVVVNQIANVTAGITTIQCMYAPEFSAQSNGMRVESVQQKQE